jgi:predicted amidohydrolase
MPPFATMCHSIIEWALHVCTVRSYYYSKVKGAHVYCAPTVDARPAWQHTMNHIALEGRCFVLSACQFTQEKDYPSDHAPNRVGNRESHPDIVVIGGGSVIISPLGKVLAGPLLEQEGVLTADLDMDDTVRGYLDLDVAGHYARPDSKSQSQPECLFSRLKINKPMYLAVFRLAVNGAGEKVKG